MARSRARILWSNPGSPPASIARALGMEVRRFSPALHKIKAANDLSGAPSLTLPRLQGREGWGREGSVTDVQDEPLGNLHDED